MKTRKSDVEKALWGIGSAGVDPRGAKAALSAAAKNWASEALLGKYHCLPPLWALGMGQEPKITSGSSAPMAF